MVHGTGMDLSPAALKILSFGAGIAGAFVTVTYFKGTEMYIPALLACGAMLGIPISVKGENRDVRELAAQVKSLLETIPPPSAPRGGQ